LLDAEAARLPLRRERLKARQAAVSKQRSGTYPAVIIAGVETEARPVAAPVAVVDDEGACRTNTVAQPAWSGPPATNR
jgi:hypothetical protein